MDTLIAEGLADAPAIAAVDARVRIPNAFARQARITTRPSVPATGEVGGTKQSENLGIAAQFVPDGIQDVARMSAGLTFDLDLWERNRALLRAARGDAAAGSVDAAQIPTEVAVEIALAYADL